MPQRPSDNGSTLAYARPLSQSSVRVYTDGDSRVISIPRRSIIPAALLALLAIGLFASAGFFALADPPPARGWFSAVVQQLLLGTLAGYLAWQAAKPYRLTITAETLELNLVEHNLEGRKTQTRRPLSAIYRVYATDHAGAIFIRAHNHEIIELPVPLRDSALHELADLIAAELGLASEPPELGPDRSALI